MLICFERPQDPSTAKQQAGYFFLDLNQCQVLSIPGETVDVHVSFKEGHKLSLVQADASKMPWLGSRDLLGLEDWTRLCPRSSISGID